MPPFVVYDSSTLEVKRTGSCQDILVSAQASAGETSMQTDVLWDPNTCEVWFDGSMYRIKLKGQ